jgi:hypothetical protein
VQLQGSEFIQVEPQQLLPIWRHKQVQFQVLRGYHVAFKAGGAGDIASAKE